MSDFDVIIVGGGIAGASLGAAIAVERRTVIVEAEDQCGYHSTGRSAAFYLESYGGPEVARLTAASGPVLEQGGYLHRRGALHLSQGDWPELPPGVEAHRIERAELERLLPGVRPAWIRALVEPGCADIDVAALHAAYLRRFAQAGGTLVTRSRLVAGRQDATNWRVELADGASFAAPIVVNAAGAWADLVAGACGVVPLGLAPKRRTIIAIDPPQGADLAARPFTYSVRVDFYMMPEAGRLLVSPADEVDDDPCDAQPEDYDIALAADRLEHYTTLKVTRIAHRWAGLRSFLVDRTPTAGFAADAPGFFWLLGQGGYGLQTAPAMAEIVESLVTGVAWPSGLAEAGVLPEQIRPERLA
jgi:D-arginine dehydrogenase